MPNNLRSLWKNYEKACLKDLPSSEIEILDKIVVLANKKESYGDLMRAVEFKLYSLRKISADSVNAEIKRLENIAETTEADDILFSLYNSLLGKTYNDMSYDYFQFPQSALTEFKNKSKEYFKKSISNPRVSSKYITSDLYPYYSNKNRLNLLVTLSCEASMFADSKKYFIENSDRFNAFLMSLKDIESRYYLKNNNKYLDGIDSLIEEYGDMDVCCEAAIAKYNILKSRRNISTEKKINFIRESLERWGSWRSADILRNEELSLICPSFRVEVSNSQIKENGKARITLANVRNIDKITTRIWKTHLTTNDIIEQMSDYSSSDNFLKNTIKKLKRRDAETIDNYFEAKDYEFSEVKFSTPKLEKGIYIIETFSNNKGVKPVYSMLFVSNLFIVSQSLPGKNVRIAVVDISKGHPVNNASVRTFIRKNYNKYSKEDIICDDNGETVLYCSNNIEKVFAYSTDDMYMLPSEINSNFNYYSYNDTESKTLIITDRSVYRPGQTVRTAVVTYKNIKSEDLKADSCVTVNLKLIDAGNKVVEEKKVITDEYGKASAEFVIPSNVLTGTFKITSDRRGFAEIRVEEYKRPTFDVHFKEPGTEYHLGDTIRVSAKSESFAGVPIQGAKVKYRIQRQYLPWLRYFEHGLNKTLVKGETFTSSDGSFFIDIPLTADSDKDSGLYYFVVEADVTDASGETQNSRLTIPVSNKKAWIECNLPEKVEKSSLHSMKITVKNISYNDIDTDVTFFIDNQKGYMFKAGEEIFTDEIFSNLSSGKHKLTIKALGEKIEKDFILFSLKDKEPAVKTDKWVYVTSDTFPTNGDSISLQIGTSMKDVHALYTVISGNKVLKSGTIELNNNVNTYRLKYSKDYGDGLLISIAWVKNGELVTDNIHLKKALPEKKLNLSWKTFRNRLVPGQNETWTLNISHSDGHPADASLAATLYDLSIDKIIRHSWDRVYGLSINLPYSYWKGTPCKMEQTNTSYAEIKYYDISNETLPVTGEYSTYDNTMPDLCYDRSYASCTRTTGISSIRMYSKSCKISSDIQAYNTKEDVIHENYTDDKVPVLRENLSEAAFFYPSLTTDSEGNIDISFTLPESLTTWKFMAFAHDRDMNNEVFTDNAVASKDIMIQPNIPRFIRHGDKAVISARISNLTDRNISGKSHMHICSAESGKILLTESKDFTIKGGETTSVSFPLASDINEDIVICKIFAEGKDFSDGEQHLLCILSDKEFIVNTRALTLTDKGDTSFDARSILSDKASDNRFTLEYTESPQWFAIESLPSVALDKGEDAISIARTIYANVMARHIAGASPVTKKIIDSITSEENGISLTSSLQENAILKNIMLEETPWVNEAESETERIRHLKDLFDKDMMNKRISDAVTKLKENQLDNGAWGWWKGMDGSRYITSAVTEMLLRLCAMTEPDNDLKLITDRALKYLADKAEEEIKEKKNLDKYVITSFGISYLYLKSFVTSRYDYYTKIIFNKLRKLSPADMGIYDKCMAAIVFYRKGYKEKAEELIKSIKEYTVYKSDTGRYFDSEYALYSWFDYKIPTQVMAIEALSLIDSEDSRTTDEMKQWLINEKRTTSWDTPINSVNAIYALTQGGRAMNRNVNSEIKINGRKTEYTVPEIGYIRSSADGYDFKIDISKKSEGTSWLSMYGSYTSEVKDVKDISTGLTIKRVTEPVDNKEITVGSKVRVTITITADRDYDFVQVTDKRAACMEPVNQISGYNGRYYCSMKDNSTNYFFDMMPKGTHIIQTDYYIDRKGTYSTGTCSVQCAYAPAFKGRTESDTIIVK